MSNSAHTSFCTVKLKNHSEATISKTLFRVEAQVAVAFGHETETRIIFSVLSLLWLHVILSDYLLPLYTSKNAVGPFINGEYGSVLISGTSKRTQTERFLCVGSSLMKPTELPLKPDCWIHSPCCHCSSEAHCLQQERPNSLDQVQV